MDPIVTGSKELGLDQLDDNSDLDILNSDTPPEEKPKGDNKIDTGVEDDEADLEDLDELDKDDEPDEEVGEEDNKEEQEKDKEDIEGSRLRPSIKQMIAKVPEAEKVFKA